MNNDEYKQAEALFKELGEWMLKKNDDGYSTMALTQAVISMAGSEMAFRIMQDVTHGTHKTWELSKEAHLGGFSELLEGMRKQMNDEFTGFDTLHDQDS